VLAQAPRDRGRRERPQARGRQLDGERDAVESTADVGDRRCHIPPQAKAGEGLLGPVEEQLDRVVVLQILRRSRSCGRIGQRWDAKTGLTGDRERLAARGQDDHRRALAQDVVGKAGAGRHQMLAVVQDQKEVTFTEALKHGVDKILGGDLGNG